MKVTIKHGILIPASLSLLISCASVPQNNSAVSETPSGTSNSIIAESEPTPAELYEKNLADLKITLISSPKETTKGKLFTSPYTLKVEKSDASSTEGFEISVLYPSSRKEGKIIFAETMITTDSEGNATFLPPTPEFSFNSEVTFYPKGDMNDAEIAKIAEKYTVKAPFKVQTNLKSAGGTLAIVDFNQNGKAITSNPISSSNLLMTLMKLGFVKIGNAPQEVTDAVIQNDEAKIHARAKSIAPSFIIFGTVKIDSSEKTESGFTYILTGSVKAMDSKTGAVTFTTEKTVTVTDKNDWNALANARKKVADEVANEIKYGI